MTYSKGLVVLQDVWLVQTDCICFNMCFLYPFHPSSAEERQEWGLFGCFKVIFTAHEMIEVFHSLEA